MRTRIIAALCTLSLTGPALAQDEQEDAAGEQPADAQTGESGGADVVTGNEVRMQPPTGAKSGDPVAPGEVHTVVRGDTLWDLSQSYLGSPWYWPKVWSYNPEIANPHWIYPGNRVRFFPAGEEGPSRVEVGTGPADEGEDISPPDLLEDTGTVQATGKIGYTPTGQTRILQQGFVTARELEDAGTIAGSFSETIMLSIPDQVYLRFKNRGDVQVGSSYVIFKTVKEVEHPESGETVGHLTHFLGRVRVVRLDREYVTAQIVEAWDEIHRGDRIGPANESMILSVAPRPNEREVDGVIAEMMIPTLTMAAEHHVVVINRGSADGVQVGNTFTVLRRGDMPGIIDPHLDQDEQWPEEAIGQCMVMDAKDKASTCLLTRSIREVMRGDRVVMRPAGQAPSASLR